MFRLGTVCLLVCGVSACDSGMFGGVPSIGAVSISPINPTALDSLTCSYEDFNGGEDVSEVSWLVNGQSAGSGDALTEGFVRGDEVTCSVMPFNGKKMGEAMTASVEIGNSAPVLSNVLLSPLEPTTVESLTCSFDAPTDVDGDTDFSFEWFWEVNGGRISQSGEVLDASLFERSDSVQCFVVASDTDSSSEEAASNTVTVLNTAPSIDGLYIDPPNPLPEDTLWCDYTDFVDVDGDADQSLIEWAVNGVSVSESVSLSSGFEAGDTVTCTVTPDDGIDVGEKRSISVLVQEIVTCDNDGDGYWTASAARFECEVLDETNYYRSIGYDCDTQGKFGATTPLVMQHQLRRSARYHSQWMADTGTFSHDSPGGPNGDTMVERINATGYSGWTRVGENIAAGYTTPADVVLGWMESDGHCRNVMNPDFNELGVGYYYDSGSTYRHWWTQNFGKR